MTTPLHNYSNPEGIRRAMRRARLYLVHDPEIAARRARADELLEGAANSLRRAALLYMQAGDLDAAKRARATLENLQEAERGASPNNAENAQVDAPATGRNHAPTQRKARPCP
ncbi:hypothetical protein [Silanimonas sp.]|uniref:hypothetical protein n=1 Tax=Silanimonas sp. TaxID=1929290 RepID=UPI0022C520D9|nr:hypothetical protein [Silanimonas sp.]MCZ8063256.1 hypothetical protein [Silanimonas sp.]